MCHCRIGIQLHLNTTMLVFTVGLHVSCYTRRSTIIRKLCLHLHQTSSVVATCWCRFGTTWWVSRVYRTIYALRGLVFDCLRCRNTTGRLRAAWQDQTSVYRGLAFERTWRIRRTAVCAYRRYCCFALLTNNVLTWRSSPHHRHCIVALCGIAATE